MQTHVDDRTTRRIRWVHRSAWLLALGKLALLAPLAAQEPEPEQPAPGAAQEVPDAAYEAEREELLALKALYQRAVEEEDPSLLAPHLHQRFTGVMVTGEAVASFEEIEDYWRRIQELMGEGGKYSLEVSAGEKVSVFGDLAVAHGTTSDKVVTGTGKKYLFNSNWTAVCKKEDGAWKILRIHDSMSDSITNEFVQAMLGGARLVSARSRAPAAS